MFNLIVINFRGILISRKMEPAYFVGLKFRDLVKKYI